MALHQQNAEIISLTLSNGKENKKQVMVTIICNIIIRKYG
jgi:hypothetical protein